MHLLSQWGKGVLALRSVPVPPLTHKAPPAMSDFEVDEPIIEPDVGHAEQTFRAPPATETLPDGERMEQRRFTGGDTLDEPITATLMRDVRSFCNLLLQTVGWNQEETAGRHEWDLWGPLIFCLLISLVLSIKTSSSNTSQTFSVVFTTVWLGQAAITTNIKFLGGTIPYLQALSITGYSLFPLLLSAVFSHIIKWKLVRIPVTAVLVVWAIWSARRGLGFGGVRASRIALAAYPLGLFYVFLGWLCVLA